MSATGHGRSSVPDAAARPVPGDPVALADEVTRQALTLPLEYGDALLDITKLLVGDPRNTSQVAAIAEAIIRSALSDPFYETTANRWRPLVPPWARVQSMSGATVTTLKRLGILVSTGRYARCDNASSRNLNKLQPIHALDVVALRELIRADAAPAQGA